MKTAFRQRNRQSRTTRPARRETSERSPVSALLPAPRRRKKQSTEVSRTEGTDWSSGRLRQQGFARQSTRKELHRESTLRLCSRIPLGLLLRNIAGSCKVNNFQNSHRTGRHSGSKSSRAELSHRTHGAIT